MGFALNGANVLVTGGAGFVGSHLADHLIDAGAARVVILDDLVRGRMQNLDAAMSTGRVAVTIGDVCDAQLVDRLTDGVDLVFHQAALRITHCAEDPVRAIRVMVMGTQNVLEAAVRHKVTKVLAASSASVYGEPQYTPMDEDHPFNNRTVYGAGKIAGEQLLRAYHDMFGLNYVALRPFNVYGPRMDVHGLYTEVMIRWLQRLARGESPVIFGDGSDTMDFIYVGDLARAYVLAASRDVTDAVFNAGSGTETSLLELCQSLCEVAGNARLLPTFAPVRVVNRVTRRLASTERARKELGFTAEIGLREGLRELVAWYSTVAASTAVRVA